MSLELVWSPLAQARLQEIHAYIALDNPVAAAKVANHIVSSASRLLRHPRLGRVVAKLGVRELVVAGTPYILVYRVNKRRVVINTVWHAAQQNPR